MRGNRQHRQDNKRIIVLLYVVVITPLYYFSGVERILSPILFQLWQIVGLGILAAMLMMRNSLYFNGFSTPFAVFQLETLIVTTLKSEFRPGILINVLTLILLVLLIQEDRGNIIHAMVIISVAAVFLNLITQLFGMSVLREDTGDPLYFIGGKNALSPVLIPGCFFIRLFYYEQAKNGADNFQLDRLNRIYWIYTVATLCSVVLGKSGTGIVVSIVAILCILTIDWLPLPKELILVGLLCAYSVILLSDKVFTSNLWIDFTTALGKDPTLTHRTQVWENSLALFKKSPLVGVGRIIAVQYTDKYKLVYTTRECHNALLQILVQGGLFGAGCWFLMLRKILQNIDLSDTPAKMVFFGWSLLMVNGLSEAISIKITFFVLCAVANTYAEEAARRKEYLRRRNLQRIRSNNKINKPIRKAK